MHRRVVLYDAIRTLESHPLSAIPLLGVYIRRLCHAAADDPTWSRSTSPTESPRLLLEQVHQRHTGAGNDVDVDLPLTQHELAGLAAASRESVVRGGHWWWGRQAASVEPRCSR